MHSAALIDVVDPLFEIDAGFNSPEHFIACAEDAFEEMKFFRKQFVNTLVSSVLAVEEIHYDDVVLLPVSYLEFEPTSDNVPAIPEVLPDPEKANVNEFVVPMLSDDPEAMSKQLMPPLIVKVPPGLISSVTFVLPPIEIAPTVKPGGTFVRVVVAPLLKAKMSSFAGVVRVGVQLVEVV